MTKVKHLSYTQEAVDKADARLIFAMDIARSTCGHSYGSREATTNGMARYAADLSEAIFDAARRRMSLIAPIPSMTRPSRGSANSDCWSIAMAVSASEGLKRRCGLTWKRSRAVPLPEKRWVIPLETNSPPPELP